MKFFLSSLIIVFSLSAGASCTIDFENEISANVRTDNLFRFVKSGKRILLSRGYHLVSATGALPRWTAFIEIDEEHGSKKLVMDLHDFRNNRAITITAPNTGDRSGVDSLLRKMPRCH